MSCDLGQEGEKYLELQEEVNRLMNMGKKGWDEIGSLPGFSIHRRASESRGDCVTFAFGVDRAVEDEDIMSQYCLVDNPQHGDIIWYIDGGLTHYGIYLGENRVRSKFGVAHVYDHPIEIAPHIFTKNINFLRKTKEKKPQETAKDLRLLEKAVQRALAGVIGLTSPSRPESSQESPRGKSGAFLRKQVRRTESK